VGRCEAIPTIGAEASATGHPAVGFPLQGSERDSCNMPNDTHRVMRSNTQSSQQLCGQYKDKSPKHNDPAHRCMMLCEDKNYVEQALEALAQIRIYWPKQRGMHLWDEANKNNNLRLPNLDRF